MCHSDHHLVTGGIPMGGFPVLGGHEGAGIVTEVGPGVEDLAPGDHVVLSFIPSCGTCPTCQAGLRNLCDLGAGLLGGAAVSDGTFRIQARGQNVFPMTLLGTFSPYMVVHRSSVVKIDRVGPVRGRRAGRLRRHHRLRFGGPHRRHPAGRGRRDRRYRRGRHGSAAGRGHRRCPQHLRDRPGRVEARPGAEVRRHARLPRHLRRDGRHHGGDARPDGPQGGRHRR